MAARRPQHPLQAATSPGDTATRPCGAPTPPCSRAHTSARPLCAAGRGMERFPSEKRGVWVVHVDDSQDKSGSMCWTNKPLCSNGLRHDFVTERLPPAIPHHEEKPLSCPSPWGEV